METMFKFITQALPRPLIAALLFRLAILQMASRIVAKMGDDGWEEDDASVGWEGRPVRSLLTRAAQDSKSVELAPDQPDPHLSTNHLHHCLLKSPL